MRENRKAFLKYVNSKSRIWGNIDLLLDEVGHLTNNKNKTETFNAFFAFVFNTDGGPWDPWSPVLEDCD